MKFNELKDALFGIKEQIAQLSEEHDYLKNQHALIRRSLGNDYYFTARWREDPDAGLTWRIDFFDGRSQIGEALEGSFYVRPGFSKEMTTACREVVTLLNQWLNDEIDWPFTEEAYPRTGDV